MVLITLNHLKTRNTKVKVAQLNDGTVHNKPAAKEEVELSTRTIAKPDNNMKMPQSIM